MRNKRLLTSFLKYCITHPQERFWQALRNWSGTAYIFGSDMTPHHITQPAKTVTRAQMEGFIMQLDDTFYKED